MKSVTIIIFRGGSSVTLDYVTNKYKRLKD